MIFLLVFIMFLTCFSPTIAFPEWQPTYDSLSNDVKNQLNTVLSEKYALLYKDMHQNCISQFKPQAVIHLHIFNGSKTTNQNEVVIWETKTAPCSLRLFSTTNAVLKEWCRRNPEKFVNFPYNHTGKALWNNDPNFVTVVQASCHRFRSGGENDTCQDEIIRCFTEDFRRVGLPAPLDFRHEQIILFVCFTILMCFVAFVVSCVYCHRVPLRNYTKARWETYWDQKEWIQINAIIEHREQMIKEFREQKLKEQRKKEQDQANAGIMETQQL